MTARRPLSAKARRAAMLRAAMARMVRVRGRFRGALLARLAHAVGRATLSCAASLLAAFGASSRHAIFVPLNALADLGLGQAGGGGGGSGRG